VLTIVLTMLLILLVAAAIVVYVAFPHRGEDVPKAGWLGDGMRKAVESLPTLEEDEAATAGDHSEQAEAPAQPSHRARR
jgi:hypothetical protein